MDVRDACALALSRVIQAIDKVIAGERVKFNHVFDEWPVFDDKYDPPAACVLAPPEYEYGDSNFVPRLLEDSIQTLAGTVPKGEAPSFGLYKTAEMIDSYFLAIRAGSAAMRSVLKLAVEDAFQSPTSPTDWTGPRYGILLQLPEYWGLTARASLLRASNVDSEDAAMRNQREATFTVRIQAPKVQLVAVHPFTATISEIFKDSQGRTISTETATFTNGARS